jgi:membrane protease YdiL (CAAX protease family)
MIDESTIEIPSYAPPSAAAAWTGLALLGCGVALLPAITELARRIVPGRRVFFARWGFSQAGLALVAAAAALIVFEFAVPADLPLRGMYAALLGLGAASAVALSSARRLQPEGWRALGIAHGMHARGLLAAVLCLLAFLPLVFGANLVWSWIEAQRTGAHEPQAVLQHVLSLHGSQLALAIAYAVVLGPLLEELVFRAFLQPLLVQNFGDRGGLVLTAILFMALHPASVYLGVLALGLLLGGLMLRTQSLLAVWGAHALHNGLMLALVFGWPGARELL